MKTKMTYSEVLAVNARNQPRKTLLAIMSKSAGLEGLVCVLEGVRKYYPNADGESFPDVINRYGAFLQVKGICGGFNAKGYLNVKEAIESDYSNFIALSTLNKHGLHVYRVPVANMERLVEANIFRLTKGRYRVRQGLMKHHTLLRQQSDRYYKITESEAADTFLKVQLKINKVIADGRLVP